MFSIIIPAYNNLDLFKSAISSVIKQKNCNFEIVIVDDSNNNEIEDYIRRKLNIPSIRYYHNRPSLGAVANWNYGISLAKGEYIVLLHHDEALDENNYLQSLNEDFNKGYNAIITKVNVIVNGQERKLVTPNWLRSFIIKHPFMLFAINVIGPTACIAIRKEYCKSFNSNLRWLVDVDWYFKVLEQKKNYIEKTKHILSFHGHKDQITENIDINKNSIEDQKEIKRYYKDNKTINLMLCINQVLSNSSLKRKVRKLIR